jgi:hypothetical protein
MCAYSSNSSFDVIYNVVVACFVVAVEHPKSFTVAQGATEGGGG